MIAFGKCVVRVVGGREEDMGVRCGSEHAPAYVVEKVKTSVRSVCVCWTGMFGHGIS